MTNLEYWRVLCNMCTAVHCGTYEYSKDRMEKEFEAISRLSYVCENADKENCKTGYIIHGHHVDEVNIFCIHMSGYETVYEYEGICVLDDLPFSINIKASEINKILFETEEEAWEHIRLKESGDNNE